ncbi:ABC transporter ATP-binding protein [Salipiger sp.]|uniref:ABC transporter ATP-binding protein n=1 Tax=Salipiger sp. TaxID=2078585 RepID=UPI003A96A3E3
MAELRIDSLTKKFGAFTALSDIDLTVGKGEVIALLGPSGCGKTTLLRCIAGLETPTSGRITVGDEALFADGVSVPPYRRNIAMVFQSYALWPHMTVWENVSYGLHVQKIAKAVIKERVGDVLRLLGLSHLSDRYPSELSGGQQQRVAVARALALQADVVLFDEPLSNLDLRLREEVRAELRRVLKQLGQTAVYVTHDIGEAVVVADRIVMMSAGNIAQVGTPQQIYHAPRNRYVADFVGNTNIVSARVQNGLGGVRLVVNDRMSFDAGQAEGQVPAGAETVPIMIRPEYVEIGTHETDPGIPARIGEVSFVGQVTAASIELDDMTLRAIALSRPNVRLEPDATCRIRIADRNIVILPDAQAMAS